MTSFGPKELRMHLHAWLGRLSMEGHATFRRRPFHGG